MKLNPDIFKAYDVRGTYPDEVHEEAARAIGAAFVAYLGAKHIGVGRDMRLSSPALAAAFIDGAIAQGAEVVDYGMIPTDMLYFAVASDGLDGGVEITASHNPEAVQRHEDGPARSVSAERRRRDFRYPRHDRRRPSAAAGRRRPAASGERNVVAPYVEHVLSFIDPAVIRPFNVVLDAGSGMAGLIAPRLFDALPCKTTRLCFEIDGRFPEPRSEPAHRGEPPRHRRARRSRRRPTSASRGTATPTAASSSTAPASSCRATSSPRCSPRRSC